MSSTTLEQGLASLGMEQYLPACQRAGLTWDSLSQLAESDFDELNIALGHRRKLQRAFARSSSWPDNMPLPTAKELKDSTTVTMSDSRSTGSTPLSPTDSIDDGEKRSPRISYTEMAAPGKGDEARVC